MRFLHIQSGSAPRAYLLKMTVQTNGNLPFKLAMVLYPLSELGLLRADKTLERELAMDAGWRSNPIRFCSHQGLREQARSHIERRFFVRARWRWWHQTQVSFRPKQATTES
jgi:hypothetical protein